EQAGVHRVELIVFDDDGATHSTVLELEILAAETEETTDSLAWIGVVLLVGVLVGVFAVRRRSSGTQSLPKWTVSPTTSHEREPGASTHHDATVEEDEARG
ncbi:MAG: LPXTG cell wall anchor domain-containing protein, partial [Candidatus Thermoplasmatota archaeon]|nr:LPXTG cell wall anchor domain-containing protein [Candidatus Thermoplasmatota archaeon]